MLRAKRTGNGGVSLGYPNTGGTMRKRCHFAAGEQGGVRHQLSIHFSALFFYFEFLKIDFLTNYTVKIRFMK